MSHFIESELNLVTKLDVKLEGAHVKQSAGATNFMSLMSKANEEKERNDKVGLRMAELGQRRYSLSAFSGRVSAHEAKAEVGRGADDSNGLHGRARRGEKL